MGTFTASLRAIGDVKSVPATLELEEGTLSIAAGSVEIGTWPLSDISLEPIPTGYRMAAEGDQILIELKDVDSFTEALNGGPRRKFKIPSLKRNTEKVQQTGSTGPSIEDEPVAPPTPVATVEVAPERSVSDESHPDRIVALPPPVESDPQPKTKKTKKDSSESAGGKALDFVDGTLAKASKRFGAYLPDWIFSRFFFGVGVVGFILMVVIPSLVSTVLLIIGTLVVLFGAVVYSDPMLASRWLPGRTTPPHVLIAGVVTLLFGILLGVIAR